MKPLSHHENPTSQPVTPQATIPLQMEPGRFASKAGVHSPVLFERNGFRIFQSNEKSGEDAFAVDPQKGIYVLADGLGSKRESSFVSQFVARRVAECIDAKTPLSEYESIFKAIAKELLVEKRQQNISLPAKVSGTEGGATTVSFSLRLSTYELEEKWRFFILGDSPVYIVDENGSIVKAYGDDTAGDRGTGAIGYREGDKIFVDTPRIFDVSLAKGQRIVMGSDFFSDNLLTSERELTKDIDFCEQAKRDGCWYSTGSKKYSMTDYKSGKVPRGADLITWNPDIEAHLAHMKSTRAFILRYKLLSDEERDKQKNNDSGNRAFMKLLDKEMAFSLVHFLEAPDVESLSALVKNCPNKADDATLIAIDPYRR